MKRRRGKSYLKKAKYKITKESQIYNIIFRDLCKIYIYMYIQIKLIQGRTSQRSSSLKLEDTALLLAHRSWILRDSAPHISPEAHKCLCSMKSYLTSHSWRVWRTSNINFPLCSWVTAVSTSRPQICFFVSESPTPGEVSIFA